MFDQSVRRRLRDPLALLGRELVARGVPANAATGVGFLVGLAAVWATAQAQWWLALTLWLANRAIDGLDGPIARASGRGPTELGGFLDIGADFAIYGGVIAALGYAEPDARVAALVVLVAYYLNGAAVLTWSGFAQNQNANPDGRAISAPVAFAEGTETIVAYVIFFICLLYTSPSPRDGLLSRMPSSA